MKDELTDENLAQGTGFKVRNTSTDVSKESIHSLVKYDLLGKLSHMTQLTRQTLAAILSGIHPSTFDLFRQNPEQFIAETARLINEQKATCIIERLSYDCLSETHEAEIFAAAQNRQDFSRAGEKLQKHIYDYAITDSNTERTFVQQLDTDEDVVVYAKLPKGFFIPTPVGDYNPDWAISFKEGTVKHIYFVAETKGSMSSMELRKIESTKIECAKRFFNAVNKRIMTEHVQYDVVDSFGKLMDIVK